MNATALSPVDRHVQLDIREFMEREVHALDERRFRDWLEFLADDITYDVPLRVVREDLAEWELSPNGRIFQDTKDTLEVRVRRLETDFSWAEQPPSRTRHFITGVLVDPTEVDGEFAVSSSCLIYRSRGDSIDPNFVSVARKDLVRRVGESFQIARRWAAIDQAVINAHNLSIFI
ncbi:aromatic-ring-hydroxylating dioxygenase subunit beta [Leucobacter triazinivorans]|uniref:3-phenylpropionate/cinnamic acid dioxygenase subunit beta n=1 Tax=Leucobacter triazinivorans TaxID=1784719 RepID=A0A4P6KCZ7_9MICO|nr:3-phenylpropionate/cinnamic acid dioxygenase subunit beta [Leucobacter triazinivorans]QBE48072.1 3-phenylpropionate/cinnamic acid dioxygenase subunit beta [Leucobacter triazinivorans]